MIHFQSTQHVSIQLPIENVTITPTPGTTRMHRFQGLPSKIYRDKNSSSNENYSAYINSGIFGQQPGASDN
jgi:hypothetical protein